MTLTSSSQQKADSALQEKLRQPDGNAKLAVLLKLRANGAGKSATKPAPDNFDDPAARQAAIVAQHMERVKTEIGDIIEKLTVRGLNPSGGYLGNFVAVLGNAQDIEEVLSWDDVESASLDRPISLIDDPRSKSNAQRAATDTVSVPAGMHYRSIVDFYEACEYRLGVGVRSDVGDLLTRPEVWTLIWIAIYELGKLAVKRTIQLLINDVFGKKDLTTDEVYELLTQIEKHLKTLNNKFNQKQDLLPELRDTIKAVNREELAKTVVANLVQHGWDKAKAEKGIIGVLDELSSDKKC